MRRLYVILRSIATEGSQNKRFEILRFAQDDKTNTKKNWQLIAASFFGLIEGFLSVYQRTAVFTQQRQTQRVRVPQVEYQDWQFIFHAQRDGGAVHNSQTAV